ncbi:MAG: hypothetical protein QM504_03510 [Pseudomonadota bacterium]
MKIENNIIKEKRDFLNTLGKNLLHLRFVELGDNINQMKLEEMITLDCLIGAWNSRWIENDVKLKSDLNLYFLSLYFDPTDFIDGLNVPSVVRNKHKLVLKCDV